jgi:hypothetical protein
MRWREIWTPQPHMDLNRSPFNGLTSAAEPSLLRLDGRSRARIVGCCRGFCPFLEPKQPLAVSCCTGLRARVAAYGKPQTAAPRPNRGPV